MKSNWVVKTIIFVLVVALYCLFFFGFGDTSRTDIEWANFGFKVFAIFAVYLASLIPTMVELKKMKISDFISIAVIYAIITFVINSLPFSEFKPLLIYNIATILVTALISVIVYNSKGKTE